MKNMRLTFLAVAASFLLMPGVASGHHGWAAFESKTTVTFKGTVTDFHFVNPHSVVDFDVKDDQGQVQSWQGELTSAARLASKGWTATSAGSRERSHHHRLSRAKRRADTADQ